MRFIHTADWQIGLKAAHVGVVGQRVRKERLAAAGRVVEAASGLDFILIAGDTFEDNGVDRLFVQKVADILAAFGGPVYIIPGNHDPLVPGSVWDHPAWGKNISILREPKPINIPGGVLFPCPAREKHSRKDPTDWIDGSGAKKIKIGLAHGTVEGVPQQEPDYPIPRDAATRAGLDYLALGHWHSTATFPDPDDAIRMAYSGTHETTKFGERNSGNILLVEIEKPGSAPQITPVKTGGLEWVSLDEEILQAGDISKIRQRIEVLDHPSTTLLSILVSGLLPMSDCAELTRLKEIIKSRFLFNSIDTSHLRPLPEDTTWLEQLPGGIVRQAASRLLALNDPGFSGQYPEGATPEVAAQALLELYALIQETAE